MFIAGLQETTLLDYPWKVATIIFTSGCNMKCWYCHNWRFVVPEEIKKRSSHMIGEGIFFRFLESRKNILDGVVICGGEPTIHGDLLHFCRKIKSLWLLVKLDTNGSHPEVLSRLIEEKVVDYIAMDVKHSFSPSYNKLIGLDIPMKKFEESINVIRQSHVDYEFRTTVIKWIHTRDDIISIAIFLAGARRYYLQNYRPWSTLDPEFSWESFTESELLRFSEDASKYVKTSYRI